MKKFLIIALAAMLVLGLCACAESDPAGTTAPGNTPSGPVGYLFTYNGYQFGVGMAMKDVKLGVKSNDLTFASGGQEATIKLTCDLKRSEVTWTSEDESIATVSADGVIKRVGTGTTKIIGQYGEQTVEIIVRCPKKK